MCMHVCLYVSIHLYGCVQAPSTPFPSLVLEKGRGFMFPESVTFHMPNPTTCAKRTTKSELNHSPAPHLYVFILLCMLQVMLEAGMSLHSSSRCWFLPYFQNN